jgi:hypothetical protein
MAKRYRYKPPIITGKSSVTPAVFATKEMIAEMNKFVFDMPRRVERGRELFLLNAAKIMLEEVRAKAPRDVPGAKDYVKHLEVALISGLPKEQAVALFYKGGERGLDVSSDEAASTVLLFAPKEGAQRWVRVLGRYQPWPPYMVPTMPGRRDAQVIARRVTREEVQRLEERIRRNRRRIESELRNSGLRGASIRVDQRSGSSVEVVDDVSYAVLRSEYGYGGPATPHWRPAMKETRKKLAILAGRFIDFLETGKENVFQIPEFVELKASEVSELDKSLQDKVSP